MNLPVIILKGLVLLPNNDIRIDFENKSIIDEAEMLHDKKILIVTDIDTLEETTKELPKFGVVARITHKLELPNNKVRVILSGIERAKVINYLNLDQKEENLESIVEIVKYDKKIKNEDKLINKLYKEIDNYSKIIPYVSNDVLGILNTVKTLDKTTDIAAPYLDVDLVRMNDYLYEVNPEVRFLMLLEDINKAIEIFNLEKDIDIKVQKNIDDSQREFVLREKLNVIKKELKETSIKETDLLDLREKLDELDAPKKIKTRIELEIRRYEALPSTSPEISVTRNYIDWLLELPWNVHTIDNDDLIDVREKLDESHNGLDKVKTRIIEYLAVKKLTNSLRSPIICLVGPPGVGKTTLAISIANAMHRKFVKMSVGGISDEAELIGHRKTYVGSSPGRVISALKKAGSNNPVFLIDEIDKMLKNFKGDPASVLLGILDPEQNKYFSDNYIEEEFDLSKVMFITTANYLEDIPEPLKDRLEIIELSGYTEYEKLDIAKKYLLPKICKEHGINFKSVIIKDEIILKIINGYTKEAGVRELDRLLSTIIRKIVTTLAKKRISTNKFYVDDKKLKDYLGYEKYKKHEKNKTALVGVTNGLAYTPYGGVVLPIEVSYFKGKGEITLTGSLGSVMKESAMVALGYIKANYKKFNLNYDLLITNDIHIHVPDGAINKDGPSAGIALTTALISAFTNKKVDSSFAMTGEITLRGNVLPIGGLKEKCIGAKNAGIKKVIIPANNTNDYMELPKEIKEGLEFIKVNNYLDVYKEVFK